MEQPNTSNVASHQLHTQSSSVFGETTQQQAAQLQRMKALSKKLLGNKKASKLFRLGLQQLVMNQPECFLNASKRQISLGQYRKAFTLLRKQLPNLDSFRTEFQQIFMHHFLHICHKLLVKFVRIEERMNEFEKDLSQQQQQQQQSQQPTGNNTSSNQPNLNGNTTPTNNSNQQQQHHHHHHHHHQHQHQHGSGSTGNPHSMNAINVPKKKQTFSTIERINALLQIQTANLSQTEALLTKLDLKSQQKKASHLSPALLSVQTIDSDFDAPFEEDFEDWRIEVFSESFLFYFLSTIKIGYKHYRAIGKNKVALSLLLRGTNFIESNIDGMFGDFKGMDIYRKAGDLLQLKANVYFEVSNIVAARKLFESAYRYYNFAGQLALKKLHSISAQSANSSLELKVENTFSSFSLNILMIAMCFEQELNYERMLDSLNTCQWINSKILQYDYSQKLRSYVADLLKESEMKYGQFLQEKGEIRRVLHKGLPHLIEMEAKANQKISPDVEMINRINNYLYEKAEVSALNEQLIIIQSQRSAKLNNNKQERPVSGCESERQTESNILQLRASGSGDTLDQLTVLVNGRQETNTTKQFTSTQLIENAKGGGGGDPTSAQNQRDFGSQSFSDYALAAGNTSKEASTFHTSIQHHHPHHSYSKTQFSSPSTSIVHNNPVLFSPTTSLFPLAGNVSSSTSSFLQSPAAGAAATSHSQLQNVSHLQMNTSNNNNSRQQQQKQDSLHVIESIRMSGHTQGSEHTRSFANSPAHTTFRSMTPAGSTKNQQQNRWQQQFQQKQGLINPLLKKKLSLGNLPTPLGSQSAVRSSMNIENGGNSNTQFGSPKSMVNSNNNNNGFLSSRENMKPKVLTTNKYFQSDLKPVSQQTQLFDFRSMTAACPAQEQKFHYLNLQPTKAKNEKNQGVLSLDFAMENLIKEKFIQNDLKLIQNQQAIQDRYSQLSQSQTQTQTQAQSMLMQSHAKNRGPSSSAHNFSREVTLNHHEGDGISEFAAANNSTQQQQLRISTLANDKQVGEQIRNLMNSLSIPSSNQRDIVDDLLAKFESEKKSLFTQSKSKMGQQGWTTEKILHELMKSINILGENVNMYNQRFAQFLSTIKEEDFDRSEFNTCLRKLVFRKKMGNGVIPSFFQDRLEPIAPIQERLQIDNEYLVIQSGGSRMNELMSDNKVVKNYFEDMHSSSDPSTTATNASTSNEEQAVKKNPEGESHDVKSLNSNNESKQPAQFKQKKKLNIGKTSSISGLTSSESSVEKMMMFGSRGGGGSGTGQGKDENYFQKSQETLRQMVLSSEMEGEEMQKEIRNPHRRQQNVHTKARTLVFTNFSNELASSVLPYTHRMRLQKSGKLDNADLLKLQNKWKNNSTKSLASQMSGNINSPLSQRLASNSISGKSSMFAFKETQ